MKHGSRKYYILNYLFLFGLIFLFLNDHFFKQAYSNWWTGKLSDFLGLLLLPMVLCYFFPKFTKENIIGTALFFVFWKSSLSQSFIDVYNQIALIPITRIVDYSDLIALTILPFSYFLLKKIKDLEKLQIRFKSVQPIMFLLPTILVFMATSPPYYYYYTFSDGELQFFKCSKTLKYSKDEVLNILAENDFDVSIDSMPIEDNRRFDFYWKDSTQSFIESYPYFKVDTIIIEKDTIRDFQFALQKISETKTKVWVNGMSLPHGVSENEVNQKLRKYYKKMIKNYLSEKLE